MVSIEIIDEDGDTSIVSPPKKNEEEKVEEETDAEPAVKAEPAAKPEAAPKTEPKAEEAKTQKPRSKKSKAKTYPPEPEYKPSSAIKEPKKGHPGKTKSTQAQTVHKFWTHKRDGNIHFKANHMKAALWSYQQAEEHMKEITKSNLATPEIKEIRISLMTNSSTVFFKQKKLQKSKQYADKALLIDPKCVKALYRRAVVYRAEGDCYSAKKDLREALRYDPENKSVKNELASVKREVETDKKKAKKVVKEAFLNKSARTCFLYDDKEEDAIENPPKPLCGVFPARYHDD